MDKNNQNYDKNKLFNSLFSLNEIKQIYCENLATKSMCLLLNGKRYKND